MSVAEIRKLIETIDKHDLDRKKQAAADMQVEEILDKREEETILSAEEFAEEEGIDLELDVDECADTVEIENVAELEIPND